MTTRERTIQQAFGGRRVQVRTIHGHEIAWAFPTDGDFRAFRHWVYKTSAARKARRKAQRDARRRNRGTA